MILTVVGAVLLVAGMVAVVSAGRARDGVPAAGWFPDPASHAPRQRRWDSRAWTGDTDADSTQKSGDRTPRSTD